MAFGRFDDRVDQPPGVTSASNGMRYTKVDDPQVVPLACVKAICNDAVGPANPEAAASPEVLLYHRLSQESERLVVLCAEFLNGIYVAG